MIGKSILIVEDEGILAIEMESFLSQCGYDVLGIAASGERALQMAEHKKPDLILMDIKLRGKIDGIDTAIMIKEKSDVAILFLSAHVDEATIDRASRLNPVGFIHKPVESRDLCPIIDKVFKNFKAVNE